MFSKAQKRVMCPGCPPRCALASSNFGTRDRCHLLEPLTSQPRLRAAVTESEARTLSCSVCSPQEDQGALKAESDGQRCVRDVAVRVTTRGYTYGQGWLPHPPAGDGWRRSFPGGEHDPPKTLTPTYPGYPVLGKTVSGCTGSRSSESHCWSRFVQVAQRHIDLSLFFFGFPSRTPELRGRCRWHKVSNINSGWMGRGPW